MKIKFEDLPWEVQLACYFINVAGFSGAFLLILMMLHELGVA